MSNNLTQPKSWWQRHWKWMISLGIITLIMVVIFWLSGMSSAVTQMAQAYADTALYENALEKVKSDSRATELLGEIAPIDKLSIIEGSVGYSNDNQTVNSSIQVKGSKLNARMDIAATRVNNKWQYQVINIRVKNPPEQRQVIEILKRDEIDFNE